MKNPHLFIIQPRQDIILLCELIEITRHQENKMGHLFLFFFSFIMISSTLQLMSTQLLLLRNEVRSIEGEEETDCKYETTGYFLQQSFVVTKTGTLS